MNTEKNVAILKEAYQTWHDTKGGSVDHWLSIMADEIRLNSLAEGADGAEFTKSSTSKKQVGDYFNGLVGQMEMIYYIVDEFVAQDDRVVMIGSTSWKHKATGKTLATPKVDVIRMKDGKITEFTEYYDTAALLAVSQP